MDNVNGKKKETRAENVTQEEKNQVLGWFTESPVFFFPHELFAQVWKEGGGKI